MLHKHKQTGVAALLVTMVVLGVAIITTLFAARIIITDQKIFKNVFDQAQADNAAQAGMQYAEGYLNDNHNYLAVTDGQTNSATLTNGAIYVATYTTDTSDINQRRITSVGKSADQTSTRTITALFHKVAKVIPTASVTRDRTQLSNFSVITRSGTDAAALAGDQIEVIDSAQIIPSYTQNIASLAAKSDATFQTDYIGKLITAYQSEAHVTYTKTANYTFNSELNGVTGKIVYLDMSGDKRATVSGSTVIGATMTPVIIFVNGDFRMDDNAVLYGNVYATGKIQMFSSPKLYGLALSLDRNQLQDNIEIFGGASSGERLQMSDNTKVTYNAANILAGAPGSYNMIPGSWRDF